MAETALLLAEQPFPAGSAGGDRRQRRRHGRARGRRRRQLGLEVPDSPPDLQCALSGARPGPTGTGNPVDAGAAPTPRHATHRGAVLASDEVDALVSWCHHRARDGSSSWDRSRACGIWPPGEAGGAAVTHGNVEVPAESIGAFASSGRSSLPPRARPGRAVRQVALDPDR